MVDESLGPTTGLYQSFPFDGLDDEPMGFKPIDDEPMGFNPMVDESLGPTTGLYQSFPFDGLEGELGEPIGVHSSGPPKKFPVRIDGASKNQFEDEVFNTRICAHFKMKHSTCIVSKMNLPSRSFDQKR